MTRDYLMTPTRELRDVLAARETRSVPVVGRSIRRLEEVLAERCPKCGDSGSVRVPIIDTYGIYVDDDVIACPACTSKREPAK